MHITIIIFMLGITGGILLAFTSFVWVAKSFVLEKSKTDWDAVEHINLSSCSGEEKNKRMQEVILLNLIHQAILLCHRGSGVFENLLDEYGENFKAFRLAKRKLDFAKKHPTLMKKCLRLPKISTEFKIFSEDKHLEMKVKRFYVDWTTINLAFSLYDKLHRMGYKWL